MYNESIYWVGKYESDAEIDFFCGSLTYYGTNKNNNRSFCPLKRRISSSQTNEFLEFLMDNIKRIIVQNPNSLFMFYNPKWAYELIAEDPSLKDKIISLNDISVFSFLNNKSQTRLWLSRICETPPFALAGKDECTFEDLQFIFPGIQEFIVQENVSSGGKGTYIVNAENEGEIKTYLNNSIFLISPRIKKAYPVNIHVCIFEKEILMFPVSLQLTLEKYQKLLYVGADFIQAQNISYDIIEKIQNKANKIGKAVQSLGYRGFLGIDFIITEDSNVLFIEINPRFQGSSLLLNKSLIENNLLSIYEINYIAFKHLRYTGKPLQNVNVNYSFVFYKKMSDTNYYTNLYKRLAASSYSQTIEDGYQADIPCDYNSYLYRCVFQKNISYINNDNELNYVESLFDIENVSLPINDFTNLVNLKISLIVQGVIIDKSALNILGEVKDATFNAVDITVFNDLRINAPTNIPFVDLSPSIIKYNALTGLCLYKNDTFISTVSIDLNDKLPNLTSKNHIPFAAIGFKSGDRVRIRHSSVCYYKTHGLSCSFCESKHNSYFELPMDDVFEVIDEYEKSVQFRHYLIGGASGNPDDEHKEIIQIASYIRSISDKPIYVMSLPPKDISVIKQYYDAGINEIAFNIEVYNRNLAQRIMPGKGTIPIEQYIGALLESVNYFGKSGNVRSMLIIGLEEKDSLFKGIKLLASMGVAPMLSVLRPMPNTKFKNAIPLSVKQISEIYNYASNICKQHQLQLGPLCEICQNNTIAISDKYHDLFSTQNN